MAALGQSAAYAVVVGSLVGYRSFGPYAVGCKTGSQTAVAVPFAD